MSALSLRLPESIHRHIKEVAKKEGVSINQFISAYYHPSYRLGRFAGAKNRSLD